MNILSSFKTGISLSIIGICLSLGTSAQAQIHNLVAGSNWHPFYISTSPTHGNYDHALDMGGNLNATLDGNLLVGAYCVDLFNPVYLGQTYPLTQLSNDGHVFGNPVANAGSVAWLAKTYAPVVSNFDEENALQAAIWRTLYGSNFEVDGADNAKAGNSAAMISAYQNFVSSLGTNTAPLDSVLWISPGSNSLPEPPFTISQGLVGVESATSSVTPELPGVAQLIPAFLPVAIVAIRKRRGNSRSKASA